MQISVSQAKAQLTELVRRAEGGDEIMFTRHGLAVARLVPVRAAADRAGRRALLESIRAAARSKILPGPNAARSQDFLFDADGMSA